MNSGVGIAGDEQVRADQIKAEQIGAELDAADRLILDEARELLVGSVVVVVGSVALADAARELGAASVRVSDDTDATTEALKPALFAGAARHPLLRLHAARNNAASCPWSERHRRPRLSAG